MAHVGHDQIIFTSHTASSKPVWQQRQDCSLPPGDLNAWTGTAGAVTLVMSFLSPGWEGGGRGVPPPEKVVTAIPSGECRQQWWVSGTFWVKTMKRKNSNIIHYLLPPHFGLYGLHLLIKSSWTSLNYKLNPIQKRKSLTKCPSMTGHIFPVSNLTIVNLWKSWLLYCEQCDQIGQFLKVIGNKFHIKSCPNIWWLFAQFWKTSLLSKKTAVGSFKSTYGKFGLLFISISGYTDCETSL